MEVEAQPQTALKNTVAGEQSQVSALQSLNSAINALVTSADGFRTGSTWTQMSATSSNDAVTVSASGSATPTNLSVQVLQSASAAEVDFAATAASLDAVVVPPTGDATQDVLNVALPDGSTTQVSTGDGKLSTIVANLNALKDADGKPLLNASAVAVGGGSYSMLVTSSATGQGTLSITDPQGNAFFAPATTTSVQGSDAKIAIGADGALTLTSSTNTFSDVVNGVDITVPAGVTSTSPVTAQISVADDGSSRANAVKAFVSQINSVLTSITAATAYGTSSGTGAAPTGGGALPGNADLRDVASQLVSTIFSPGDDISLANMGLSVDRYGALTFDPDAFETAYQADPQGVTQAFTGSSSFISRVEDVANAASAPASGSISSLITSMNSQITQQNDEIADWDDRLAQKQAHLEQVYDSLQTTLVQLQSQSSWISSQLSSLDSGWEQNS